MHELGVLREAGMLTVDVRLTPESSEIGFDPDNPDLLAWSRAASWHYTPYVSFPLSILSSVVFLH